MHHITSRPVICRFPFPSRIKTSTGIISPPFSQASAVAITLIHTFGFCLKYCWGPRKLRPRGVISLDKVSFPSSGGDLRNARIFSRSKLHTGFIGVFWMIFDNARPEKNYLLHANLSLPAGAESKSVWLFPISHLRYNRRIQ